MSSIISEQMVSLRKVLSELNENPASVEKVSKHVDPRALDVAPAHPLSGSVNARQLADLLDIHNIGLFRRSIIKTQAGHADKLTRQELTELSVAFVKLLDADPRDTQKALMILKRVSRRKHPEHTDHHEG
jgi:hypothetical protein